MTHTLALLPARFVSLQTFNADKQLVCLKHHIHENGFISTPSDRAALNQIYMPAGDKRLQIEIGRIYGLKNKFILTTPDA